jgi:hypothetical protein
MHSAKRLDQDPHEVNADPEHLLASYGCPYYSVANPGCLSRIPVQVRTFFVNPDPDIFRHPGFYLKRGVKKTFSCLIR